ncbi:hypothetical protein ONZ45_g3108 [Pleurotus djamor]|nr:hypothetical protein ONZ45_g3108 [Pleurotus djamor]
MPTFSSPSSPLRRDVKPKLEHASPFASDREHSPAASMASHQFKSEGKLEDVTDDEKCMKREENTHRPRFSRRCLVCWIEVPSKQSVMRSYRRNLTRFTYDNSWTQNTRPSITQSSRRSEPPEDENTLDFMPPARHESVVSLTEAPDAGRSTSPARFRSFSELDAMDVDDLATPPPFPDHVEHPSPTASETAVRRSSSTPPDAADPDIIDLTLETPVEPPSDEPQINIDFNPKIKAIKNELVIPFDIFAERYARIGGHRLYPIALDPEFRDKPTTRKVISGLYGGNPQEAFPRPSKQKIARHGI